MGGTRQQRGPPRITSERSRGELLEPRSMDTHFSRIASRDNLTPDNDSHGRRRHHDRPRHTDPTGHSSRPRTQVHAAPRSAVLLTRSRLRSFENSNRGALPSTRSSRSTTVGETREVWNEFRLS